MRRLSKNRLFFAFPVRAVLKRMRTIPLSTLRNLGQGHPSHEERFLLWKAVEKNRSRLRSEGPIESAWWQSVETIRRGFRVVAKQAAEKIP